MSVSNKMVSPSLAREWVNRFTTCLSPKGVSPSACRKAVLSALGMTKLPVGGEVDLVAPIALELVKGWAKVSVKSLVKDGQAVTLSMTQAAWSQALGCSGWRAMSMHLAQVNQARATLAKISAVNVVAGLVDKTMPPVIKGDWVMEREVQNPDLGKVKDCYWDEHAHEWVMDVVLYNADGVRVGRSSPRMGGPAGFEPAVPVQYWERVVKPEFPLGRDFTGYRDWRKFVSVLPARDDLKALAIEARREELTAAAIDHALSIGEETWFQSGGDAEAMASISIDAVMEALAGDDEDETLIDTGRVVEAIETEFGDMDDENEGGDEEE